MILQALADYYWRKQSDPDPAERLPAYGLEEKEIAFVIELDADGTLIGVGDTRTGEGKQRVGQRFLVPQGVKKTSGVAANLLWDNAEYLLGVPDPKKLESKRRDGEEKAADYLARLGEMRAAFRAKVEALPEPAKSDPGTRAVLAFLTGLDRAVLESLPVWPDILSGAPLLSFRLHGDLDLVCQRSAVIAIATRGGGDACDGHCLLTGEAAPIERLHTAIKGVWGAQTSGANIVSFNLDAFRSYGKEKGENAPIGKPAAFAYTTALNNLLSKGSRQRLQVGDASTVFWAERPNDLENLVPDLFGEPGKDNPDAGTDALRALYTAVQSGRFAVGDGQDRFHVLGLAPNAARISIRFWETAPALELARRILRHFEALRIARGPRDPEHLSLFRLLAACAVQGKADNIPPTLGGDVMRAILQDLPYPATLLHATVLRCRAEQRVTYPRAAVIKAWLIRAGRVQRPAPTPFEKEILPMLDPDNPSPAYRMGRLFAALEKIQEEASPSLNATIRDRYYGAASGTPVAVFPALLRLKNHHLGKLNPGRSVNLERLLGEILSEVHDFPTHLSMPDQGRFALGYYHQRQAFFTRSEKTDDPAADKE
ncbi:MAG: type I-C CRISPR-associated protein Cas8c/Csd1 [Chromatiaceae bacterium]|jgi:CRISPR-associated protein Csd1|nr:type I-C CRISPR-associated protein Cas8c/Csd1 [Chromatiaceae bacterium]